MNKVKQALLDGTACLGSWIQIGSPDVAEIMADCGFDWLALDLEHTDISLHQAAIMISIIEKHGVVPFVRVRENDVMAIRQVLDLGAKGVIIPLVEFKVDAERAVSAAKYPSRGFSVFHRGFAYCRANDWGRKFAEYVKEANDEIAVVAMIETDTGVGHVESILAVDGIDGIFIGPYDLSGSYGMPGAVKAPAVVDACNKIVAACKLAGKSAGLHIVEPGPGDVEAAKRDGFTFLAVGMDTVFLRSGGEWR